MIKQNSLQFEDKMPMGSFKKGSLDGEEDEEDEEDDERWEEGMDGLTNISIKHITKYKRK